MKYRAAFLTEVARFDSCGRLPAHGEHVSDVGLQQFFDKESRGVEAAIPDWYYLLLLNGKRWWEWTLNFYAERFFTGDWDGWWQLALDFWYDARGFRQLRQRLGFKPVNPDDFILLNLLPDDQFLGSGI